MSHVIKLVELPVASTAFTSDVLLEHLGSELKLHFEYYREGRRWRTVLQFRGVRAHAHRAEGVSLPEDLESYDAVCEVMDSQWRNEIEVLDRQRGYPIGGLRHFRIYIDSDGCYETVANAWELESPALVPVELD